jgi:two-component system response regulator HydG
VGDGGPAAVELDLRRRVEAFERGLIAQALAASGGNKSEAARRLGINRVTLLDKLRKHGLSAEGEGG